MNKKFESIDFIFGIIYSVLEAMLTIFVYTYNKMTEMLFMLFEKFYGKRVYVVDRNIKQIGKYEYLITFAYTNNTTVKFRGHPSTGWFDCSDGTEFRYYREMHDSIYDLDSAVRVFEWNAEKVGK